MGSVLKSVAGLAGPVLSMIPGVSTAARVGGFVGGQLLGGGGGSQQQYNPWQGMGNPNTLGSPAWKAVQQGQGTVQGGPSGGFSASGGAAGPQFPQVPSGPNAQDTADQTELLRISQLFEQLSTDLGMREDELFSLFKDQLALSQDPSFGTLSADEVANFGGQVGSSVGRQLFAPGGQVEDALNQGLGQNIESGFGIGGGTSNALLNAFKQANVQSRDAGITASAQFAGPLASVVNANTAASSQRSNLLANLFQSAGGARNTALENLFGSTANAQELPLGREQTRLGIAGTRQGLQQQQDAFPYIIDALKGPSILDRFGQSATDAFGNKIGQAVGGLDVGKTIKDIGGWLGIGGGGGSNGFSLPNQNNGGTYFGGTNSGSTGGSGFFPQNTNPFFNAQTDIFKPLGFGQGS